jgi:hypothetical protein
MATIGAIFDKQRPGRRAYLGADLIFRESRHAVVARILTMQHPFEEPT